MSENNINKVLENLAKAFAGKEVTLTTIEEEKKPEKIKGQIIGFWISRDGKSVHFVFIKTRTSFIHEFSVPVEINQVDEWCHLPYEFGESLGNAIKVPEFDDMPSFLQAFHACLI